MHDVRMRGFSSRSSVAVAKTILERRIEALDSEPISVVDAADRVLAEDVTAVVSVPHFRRSMMDGWAVVADATSIAPVMLDVVGDSRPGRPYVGAVAGKQAVRITTGAAVPEGADAVIMAERGAEIVSEERTLLQIDHAAASGKHVGEIGEDVSAGAIVATRGRRLRPQDLGLIASVGIGVVHVVRRPRVRIVITGDELLPPGSMPTGANIVDANSIVLAALANRDGAIVSSIVRAPDRYELVRDAIASSTEDVVLVSGGSSVGPEDHAPLALAEIGEVVVHGVAMRPSSPAGFGFVQATSRDRPVFLLPGNPVACLCAYEFFAGPTIRSLGGRSRAWPHRRSTGRLTSKIASELGRVDYVRVTCSDDRVTPIATTGASILSSTTRADGAVIVPAESAGLDEDTVVEVLLYD